MDIGSKIKKYRKKHSFTQKTLAEKIGVSDKTISSWENGRTLPDVETLLILSEILEIPIFEAKEELPKKSTDTFRSDNEQFLPEEDFYKKDQQPLKKVRKIKANLVKKVSLILSFFLLISSVIFLNSFQHRNSFIDRFNPFLEYSVGYAALPVENFDEIEEFWVLNDEFGHGTWLNFNINPINKEKKYAMVKHKGIHVSEVRLITWESIPGPYQEIMPFDFDESQLRIGSEPVSH